MAELDVIYHLKGTKDGVEMTMYTKSDVKAKIKSAVWKMPMRPGKIAECSNCHSEVEIEKAIRYPYCPYCGSRMSGEEKMDEGKADDN